MDVFKFFVASEFLYNKLNVKTAKSPAEGLGLLPQVQRLGSPSVAADAFQASALPPAFFRY